MGTELCFSWDGQERLRLTVRSNEDGRIETNRRARRLIIPAGAEIRSPDDEEVIGIVTRVYGLGGNRYAIEYSPPITAKRKKRRRKPAHVDDDVDALLLAADAVVAEVADVLRVEGEAEIYE